MKEDINIKNAIVREIANTYNNCVVTFSDTPLIDVSLAKQQHNNYCNVLSQVGVDITKLEADDNLPDCCFVEDTAIIIEDIAIITYLGTESRVNETYEIEKSLKNYKKIYHINLPGTIEGGDVLKIDKKIYVGISQRTNIEGINQLALIVKDKGYEVIGVNIWDTLHLKSACTYLGNNVVIFSQGHFDESIFSSYDTIIVPKEEEYCANTLTINGQVLIPKGFPITKGLITIKGFSVIELEMTEIQKAEGALTCLSLLF